MRKPESQCRAYIASITPPYHELVDLVDRLKARKKECVHPSCASGVGTVAQDFAFHVIYKLYDTARCYEKQNDACRALDYYLFILFNFVPLGSAYYERPAIILEKMKQYDAALAVCSLIIGTLKWQRKIEKASYSEEFQHRIERLEGKKRKE